MDILSQYTSYPVNVYIDSCNRFFRQFLGMYTDHLLFPHHSMLSYWYPLHLLLGQDTYQKCAGTQSPEKFLCLFLMKTKSVKPEAPLLISDLYSFRFYLLKIPFQHSNYPLQPSLLSNFSTLEVPVLYHPLDFYLHQKEYCSRNNRIFQTFHFHLR